MLAATRKAIARIEYSALRGDFLSLAAGAEFGIATRKKAMAAACMNRLVVLAFAVNRTISPRLAVAVLDGLTRDARRFAIGLDLRTRKKRRCVVGDDIGSSGCKLGGSVCYTIVGQPGCGGPSGFHL